MRRTQTKNTARSEEARPQRHLLLVETHRRLTFIAVLTVHTKTSLVFTFQRSMQANKNINLWEEKAPVYRLSRSEAPKTQQICHYKHTRKTGELFCLSTRASTLVSATTLLTQVPLQKFPFLFISINFLVYMLNLHGVVCSLLRTDNSCILSQALLDWIGLSIKIT